MRVRETEPGHTLALPELWYNRNPVPRRAWPGTCSRASSLWQSVFDILDGEEMRRARTRANPYEMIRGVFFLNRLADSPASCLHSSAFRLTLGFPYPDPCFSFFLCYRAAMKMANMDFVFDRMFTNPLDSSGVRFCGVQSFSMGSLSSHLFSASECVPTIR